MTDVPDQRRTLPVAAVAVLAAGVAMVVGMAIGTALDGHDPAAGPPAAGSAEAGFARDMQVHHGQAVEMSVLVRESTDDPEVAILALDIMLTQQQQAGQMYGWLEQWDLTQASSEAPMTWMADGSDMTTMDHGEAPDASSRATPMPGMATEDDLRRLDAAEGVEAEALYLQLMIAHHQGGVEMAQAALERATDDDVRRLAQAIVDSQTAELAVLKQMLPERASYL